jgi:hypothetical protein
VTLGPGFLYGEYAYGLGIYSYEEALVPPIEVGWLPVECQPAAWEIAACPTPPWLPPEGQAAVWATKASPVTPNWLTSDPPAVLWR